LLFVHVEVHNRISIHTVYRLTSYRIQYNLVPITVNGPKKQDNFKKYRLIQGDVPFPLSLATFLTNGTCSKNVTLLKSFLSYPTSIWFSASSLSSSLPEEEEDVLV
jgi:hypothetical protein